MWQQKRTGWPIVGSSNVQVGRGNGRRAATRAIGTLVDGAGRHYLFDFLVVSFFQNPGFLALPVVGAGAAGCSLSFSMSNRLGSPFFWLTVIWTLLQWLASCSPSTKACCRSRIIFLRIVFFIDRCFSMFSHSPCCCFSFLWFLSSSLLLLPVEINVKDFTWRVSLTNTSVVPKSRMFCIFA